MPGPNLLELLIAMAHFSAQSLPPKPKWGVENIPDLSGKVFIVTGANAGIGYETAKALVTKNAKVYMACRNPEKARAAIEKMKGETGKEAEFLQLDLSDLKAVKSASDEFMR